MKTALLISGYLRTFELNLPNLTSKILDQFDNIDIYIHITKNGEKKDKYLNTNKDINNIIKILNPVCLLYEDDVYFSEDFKINNLFNSWLKYYKLNQIKKLNETVKGKYDLVIKYRPDLSILSETDNIFKTNIDDNIIYLPEDSKIDKDKLFKQNDEYICDIFAFGNSEVMNRYFDIYLCLNKLIEKYGSKISETLLYKHLKDSNINFEKLNIEYNIILSLCNVFAIAGDSGSGKTTLGNILKKYFSSSFMLECDRYHKWERKDTNWNNFTHLNPDANYLTKMNDDIFDLKIGKTIYQVDYNHETGKFTEPEAINSSDNIIVCGLHSLYSKDENIYDLKIFIDTDDTLKYFWKISRDVNKRGYSIEQVIKQIEARKYDYIKYILPQKENSDIIINFFTDEKFDINNLEQNPNIKLKIMVHKKYNFLEIIYKFNEQKLKFDFVLDETSNFNSLIFNEYVEHNLSFNNGNYYDYILFLFFNLNK